MPSKSILAACIGAAGAVSVEFISSDLNGGSNKVVDNVKAEWKQDLKVLGNDATLTSTYDRSANANFLSEAKLTGAVKNIKYELTKAFGGGIDWNLETSTNDGTTIEAEGNDGAGLTKLTAGRSTKFGDQDCSLEASYDVGSSASKLKLSSVLGGGVTGTATMGLGGDSGTAYEVEYDTTLTEGRTLSATVNPLDGTGEVEYEDNASIDATITASMDLSGGSPKVTVKRAWNF
jgi:hypothetical protein